VAAASDYFAQMGLVLVGFVSCWCTCFIFYFTWHFVFSTCNDILFLKAGIPCKLSPEAWIKDLAGTKPLSVLAKKVCVVYLHGI